jgi:hypothetical protein
VVEWLEHEADSSCLPNAEVKKCMELFFFYIYLACEDVNNIVLAHKFLKGFLHPEVPALIPVVQSCNFRFSELLFFMGKYYTHTYMNSLRT